MCTGGRRVDELKVRPAVFIDGVCLDTKNSEGAQVERGTKKLR